MAPQHDPRPMARDVKSKAFMSRAVTALIEVDPLFRLKCPGLKAEEVCLNTLRELGYPYMLSKQYLATPGAPHAWPSVLAALDWLREEVVESHEFKHGGYMFKYDDDQVREEEPLGRLLYEIAVYVYHVQLKGEQISESTVEVSNPFS
ncbi:unnamed protein product [Echinostoma caproni]|uniref:Kinetochore protein NDC80 n=1 Tax=Echinostoma caproni TaxID=27848 RepID=A0A183A0I4_9TREM|nr:unnamed protein product [Echinostoma caproni]